MEKYVIPPFLKLDFKVPALLLLTVMKTLRLSISADGQSAMKRHVTPRWLPCRSAMIRSDRACVSWQAEALTQLNLS